MQPETKRYLLIAAQVFAIFGIGGFIIYQGWNETTPGPCDEGTFPARCYLVPKKACEVNWAQAEVDCKARIDKLSLPPTQLIGPIMQKCLQSSMDQSFTYSRASTPECTELHEDLEGWRMRNPDFR